MPVGKRLIFFPLPQIFLLLLFFTFNNSSGYSSSTNPTSSCPPLSCGNIITDIKSPFWLKTAPDSCREGLSYYEIDCQNNQTILVDAVSKEKRYYYVQEINYKKGFIRVVEPGIRRGKGNFSSCPLYTDSSHYYFVNSVRNLLVKPIEGQRAVAFIHCLFLVNSVRYVKAPFCGNRSNIFANSSKFYSYVMVGQDLKVSDLEESCMVDRITLSRPLDMSHNPSLATIYNALADGFEISWYNQRYCRWNLNLLDWSYITFQCCDHYGICYFEYRATAISVLEVTCIVFWVVVGLLVLRFTMGFPLLLGLVVHKWRRRHLSMDKAIEEFLQGENNRIPIKYTYSEIKQMTNKFSEKLGEGAYGTVYKGKLRSGPYVAIKMMEQSMDTEEEFISEVGTIGRIHHVNVVQLIGFCVERSKCALVYEFLPNGSLDRYIFNQQSLDILALTFEKMFEIALGVARAIGYLHHGCDMQILHFDIKPHNILLDEKFNPKISDFGLAKLYPVDESCINLTAARGTMGYMAPEMFYKNFGGISYKADIYSFGMMLMEMVGRRNIMNPFVDETNQLYFPSWVYDQLCAGNDIDIIDATEEERKLVKRIIVVALWCIQMRPSNRPSMNKVVEMLEGDSEPRMPPRPFEAPREITLDDQGILRLTA